ncbi:hypothetical protein IB678_07805 [Francisella adeliensis]|uniref:Uncharacterized protein n=1 Tax=Francisella adeliensis TaxID=2007306 RepID=A0A2Z4XXK1_9GAMM|nr:hypothetical protein CDH04_04025 [Francisella adeliensis]MBK2085128.1 hypothetical protein [Francisella adeliensis]MBK2097395.1 hypothetical protein [Francisella adeliensis]QIW11861.1 hypothetical protein FZC43_04025 [Francisella adeliensis]QIW13737.1 hypothetical protein FZC44_04025 [Francisella adeliensis]
MNLNVKQILSSALMIAIGIFAFILLAPFFVFIIIFFMIFSLVVKRKIMKQNPDFFKNAKGKKGRVIDQEDENSFTQDNQNNQQLH